MTGTVWALLPPIIAIVLALLTKEVYLSLIVGIVTGAFMYTGFQPVEALDVMFSIMTSKIGDNCDILIFLVFLGILVALITMSGASRAYGKWALKIIKSKRQALFATSCLGVLIFVDDYFNCLTVGAVMKPITDKFKITRAKLAYIIDATAAPVCIIAPISSWAAAVGSSLPKNSNIDGFMLFIKAIPFNYYALLTLVFVVFLILLNEDFSKMKKYETIVQKESEQKAEHEVHVIGKGKVKDLILPIVFLIVSCIGFMLYTGGFFTGKGVIEALSNCSSGRSLVLGSFVILIFTFLLYIPRKVIGFVDFCGSFAQGFKAMTSAIMILCLAWTLSGICGNEYLQIGAFVGGVIQGHMAANIVLPMIFFLVALGLSFATGTSWGTFGILIPIAVAVVGQIPAMLALLVGSILSGAVCGDHVSPISDTTILASAGARCVHINHVSTQLPYAMLVAVCSMAGYLVAGISGNGYIGLVVSFICLAFVMAGIVLKIKKA
ncbi:MAG: Na+/H+ antiporter NhaC family protein [Anaerostipes sp.]|nr:Na+/H+ antiporter NhaC family protein [Anaerostipes sp.]